MVGRIWCLAYLSVYDNDTGTRAPAPAPALSVRLPLTPRSRVLQAVASSPRVNIRGGMLSLLFVDDVTGCSCYCCTHELFLLGGLPVEENVPHGLNRAYTSKYTLILHCVYSTRSSIIISLAIRQCAA